MDDLDRSSRAARDWLDEAIRRVEADANRSADTHLVPLRLTRFPGIDLYLKDESTHPTGSLKHRLARAHRAGRRRVPSRRRSHHGVCRGGEIGGGNWRALPRPVHLRRTGHHDTFLAVVDPENSAFFPGWRDCDDAVTMSTGSRIEGIGRPRVEPSFIGGVVDRMIAVPDAASVAAARALEPVLGRRVGASTGTNLWGALHIARELHAAGRDASIVTLLCDGGECYAHTYFDDGWLAEHGLDLEPYREQLRTLLG